MDRSITDIASMVNEILTFVRCEGQRMEIGEVERHLLSRVMAVGRAALEEFVAEKGTGYAGKEIVDAQGNRCPYVRDRSCSYRWIFGTVSIGRAYYHTPVHRESFLRTRSRGVVSRTVQTTRLLV